MERKRKLHLSQSAVDENYFNIATPHIELSANRSAVVEGCEGIMEYSCDKVRINCGSIIVCFCGNCLEIEALTTERISVKGTIVSMEFCT